MTGHELAGLKHDLRHTLRARRRELGAGDLAVRSDAAAARLVDALDAHLPAAVSIFLSLAEEIDTGPAIRRLRERRCSLLLPRQVAKGQALDLHRWEDGDRLVPGGFGVLEPAATAPRGRPRIVVVPLLGFDALGNRLGYGAGFYDRTLAGLRAGDEPVLAVGLAFELQRLDQVPTDATDQRLDAIVTESATIWF